MAIPVTCPSCRFEGEAPDDTAGQTVLCPECRFNIPVPASRTSRTTERPRDRPSDRPTRRPPDDDDDDDDDRRSRRRSSRRRSGTGSVCHFCGSDAPPIYSSPISAAGWIVMVVVLFFCPLFFWSGWLIKENIKKCSDCGARL